MKTVFKDIAKEILDVLLKIEAKVVQAAVLKPPHSTGDDEKINRFVQIVSKQGWMGVELVVGSSGHLLTGTHRFLALKRMGWKDEQIPTISIKELCEKAGIDMNSTKSKGPIRRGAPAFDEIKEKLPKELRRKYGL